MVDAHDSKSCLARGGGSSPLSGTKFMKPKVLVIVGPTASGKSDLAVKLAKKFKGEIISADSRQVYKGLNIGTGKITKREMQGVPHYLLDIADPKRQVTVSDYKNLARWSIRWILEKKKLPIIVATSLPEVPANPKLRKQLEKMSAEELYKMLVSNDPRRAKMIDRHNKVRIIRALEIIEALGKVPEISKTKSEFDFIFIGLKPDQKDLEKKIYTRLIKRLPSMIQEAKKLHSGGLSWKRMDQLGLEYRYLARYLKNPPAGGTKQEFIDQLYVAIKQYSKRQMTWFKRNKSTKWFEPAEYKAIEKYARMAL